MPPTIIIYKHSEIYLSNNETKNFCTFVISEGEVEITHNRCSQAKIKAMTTQGFILIHCTDGLDYLWTKRRTKRQLRSVSFQIFI